MYSLSCAAMGHTECSFVAKGETQEEVLNELMAHAKEHHPEDIAKMESMTPEEMQGMKQMAMSKMVQE
jgi:predicted small metal-binding protein